MRQSQAQDGSIEANRPAAERILSLGSDPSLDEQPHEDGDDRHGEERCRRHGERLGQRQRPEQPPLLRLEREHGHERERDDEERDEERRPHLAR